MKSALQEFCYVGQKVAFQKCNAVNTSHEDQLRSDQSPTQISVLLHQAVKENTTTSTRRLPAELGTAQPTVHKTSYM